MGQINELLRLCRERAGMTQQQLADKLYVDRSTIAKVETGVIQHPSYTIVKAWAKATNSEDIVSLDISGKEGWRKLRTMEIVFGQIKSAMESVTFLRKRKVG